MASKPGQGPIVTSTSPQKTTKHAPTKAKGGRTQDGTWRPDEPFTTGAGLKITMRRAANLTPRGFLEVPLRFQVPVLGDFDRPQSTNWATFDTISGGQRARPMGDQIPEIQVQTMLMDRIAAEASSGIVVWDGVNQPQRLLAELRHIRKSKVPFRLVINQPAIWPDPVINTVAVLTSVTPTLPSGELGTEMVALSFMHYPENRVRSQRRHQKPSRKHKLKLDDPAKNDRGDSLYSLAKHYFHRASAWREIAKKNGITGVSPGSESELTKWAKRHHKTTLVIPSTELVSRFKGDGAAQLGSSLSDGQGSTEGL